MLGLAGSRVGAQDLEQMRKLLSSGTGNDNLNSLEMRKQPIPSLEDETISQSPFEGTAIVGDAPVDSDYVIGPGDMFQLFIESAALDKQVNAEGNIVVNRIGVIHVAGLNLKAAKQVIMERVQAKKIRSQCFVNLGRPKTMKVYIVGAVNAPGVYQVGGFVRVTDLITLAQGLTPMAQRGAVTLVSSSGARVQADLKKFYLQGDPSGNPYLTQGSTVMIPFVDYSKPVLYVRRDTLNLAVQLEPDETISNILMKAASYKGVPSPANVIVTGADGKRKRLSPGEALTYKPAAGDTLDFVAPHREVYIGGAVFHPGYLPYRSDCKVAQYISEAGLISSSSIPNRIKVYRADGSETELRLGRDALEPGDMVFVGQNAEQKFINYTPIVLSVASLTLAIITVMGK